MSRMKTVVWAAALAGAVLAAPGPLAPHAHGEGQDMDFLKIQKAVPRMRELADQGHENSLKLHQYVDELETTTNELTRRELRPKIYAVLEDHIKLKQQVVDVSRDVLGIKKAPLSNQEVRNRLREMELRAINWEKDAFAKCMRDISGAINVPIRLQYFVVQRNTVEMKMRQASAETVLGSLCSGFDLRYVVHDGEIVIYKKITPTESRFISYQERHPNVKLKYWKREKASGDYEIEEK